MTVSFAVTLCGVVGVMMTPAISAVVVTDGLSAPANLRCEYLVDPQGIDATTPRLSWEMVDTRRGAAQSAYLILVADDPDKLASDDGNLWDSGKVASDRSIQVEYAGKPQQSRMRVWWKVRVWDAAGQPSPWSMPASWSMGLLEQSDWQAQWIGDPTPPPTMKPANNGYHSQLPESADTAKWLTIDLGQPTEIDAVKLYPARPYNWKSDEPGFLFPQRFRIELSDDADFAESRAVVDKTADDVPDPGTAAQTYSFSPTSARYVRLMVTRLRVRNENQYGFALAEMQVLAQGNNVAAGKPVSATDSVERHGWSKRYVTDEELVSRGPLGWDPLVPPMLRRGFELAGEVKRATAYVTALGLYELRINGRRVGDHVLAPEWTDYHKRIQYQTFDVTALLHAGQNAIGVALADGWYAGRLGLSGAAPGGWPRAIYGQQPRLLLQMEIELADGSVQRVISDGSWRCTTEGPLRVADLLDGETYDARRDMPGWDTAEYDDSAWQSAGVFDAPNAALVAQPNEPIRVVTERKPISVNEQQPGVFVFDLGQNMVGWCRLKVRGARDDVITLRHAEVLNPDGSIYTANLRGASQTDTCTLRGSGEEVFEPRFTYHGFRYVEVTGLSEKPTLDTLTGCVVHSASPLVGEFECSSPLLNQLWSNILWTQRSNMHSVPTDCPQRDERCGWMGDILAFAQTACFNMDMSAFFTKWIPDVRDAQTADGRYPDFAPHPYVPEKRFSGVPAWGDAGVFVPWCVYVNYGDRRMLVEHYESARRWVDWIRENNPDLLWKNKRHNDYGDWLNADTLKLEGWPSKGAAMPKDAFGTAFFARSTQIVAEMATVLGREEDAKRYAALADDIAAAFNRAYVQPDGSMTGNTQAGYAIALHFNLLPEELCGQAAKRMVDCFQKYGGQISTGFHSTICLMRELSSRGYNDEAYRLIFNRKMPSWGYAIDHGATTIWERWDAYVEGRGFQNPGMNSFSHYAIGSVGEWMYRVILGINPDPKIPAYKHIVIRPQPGGDLKWAKGSYHSVHGKIASGWKIDGDSLVFHVTIPANTTATIHIPATEAALVSETGQALDAAKHVRFAGFVNGAAVCEVGAGTYEFVSKRWTE